MAPSHPTSTFPLFWSAVFALGIFSFYLVQVLGTRQNAALSVGIFTTESAEGVRIDEVIRDRPASVAGLRAGDLLLEVDGIPIASHRDYDTAAARFSGAPVVYHVRRGERDLNLQLTPGVPVEWRRPLINGAVMLFCLSLGLLTRLRRPRAARPRLLWALLFLMALEMALPFDTLGHPQLSLLVWLVFYLVTGAQISVELHLATLIPERPSWLDRRPWVIPLYYIFGLGLGGVTGLTVLVEAFSPARFLPWSEAQISSLLTDVAVPLWAGGVVVLLAYPALRYEERTGRLQAWFVLLGVLPWAAYVFLSPVLSLLGRSVPAWVDEVIFPLVVLAYPIAIFLAIYRYHLLNIGLLVRQSLLYSSLTTALLLVFYGALGAGGALFSQLVGSERHSIWVISASTLILGILFSPMRSWLQKRIDRSLFPERQALRQRLIHLASELPRQGTTQRMGHHLVDRLCEIFAVRSAALLLAAPEIDLLLTIARKPRSPDEKTTTLTLLVPPHDPGIELLRLTGAPLSRDRLVEESPELRIRLKRLQAEVLVPLLYEDRLVGVLTLGPPKMEAYLPAEQLELLNLVAHHVAISLENVRLFESATYEGLTGLLRREAILEVFEKELERAQRYGRPLAIALADLDHFKRINDEHGHLAGDALLKSVAGELADGMRSTDALGRYGGEEFLLVFPETDLERAFVVAEKIRSRIEKLVVPLQGDTSVDVRISVGLSSLEEFDDPARCQSRALLEAADKALYQAKRNGRNRVEPSVGSRPGP